MKSFVKMLPTCSMAVLFCACLVGCNLSATYSADSIKTQLTNAGYVVSESFDLQFDDDTMASQLPGIQKIFAIVKGEDADKEFSVILVFDSIKNADSGVNDQRLCDIYDNAKYQCGSNKKDSTTMGRFNNVVFAGPEACKQAAGLKPF